jgi:hypothetical protein
VDLLDKLEDGRSVEAVKYAVTQNHVEATVLGLGQAAHVVLMKANIVETELLLQEFRLVQIRLSALDAHNWCAVEAEFDRIMPLVASHVKHSKLVERLAPKIRDGLHEATQAAIATSHLTGEYTISEMDARPERAARGDEL